MFIIGTLFLISFLILIIFNLLDKEWLEKSTSIFLISTVICSKILIDYIIGIGSIGNVFFTFAIFSQMIIYFKYGRDALRINTYKVLLLLSILFLFQYLSIEYVNFELNHEIFYTYFELNKLIFPILLSTLIGFFISQSIILFILSEIKIKSIRIKSFICMFISQFIDSVIFYILLNNNSHQFNEVMITGFNVRILIGGFLSFITPSILKYKFNNIE